MSVIKTPKTHPDHHIVGRFFAAPTFSNGAQIYFCDYYDPLVDYHMVNVNNSNDQRTVSPRAISQTWFEAFERDSYWFVLGSGEKIEKSSIQKQ